MEEREPVGLCLTIIGGVITVKEIMRGLTCSPKDVINAYRIMMGKLQIMTMNAVDE
jgi:hypothetical protein